MFSGHTERHRSFKLRLPSIRRDLTKSPNRDPENPPEAEESVPLNRYTKSVRRLKRRQIISQSWLPVQMDCQFYIQDVIHLLL